MCTKQQKRENVCAQGETNKVKEGMKEVYPSLIYLICAGKSQRQVLQYHLNAFGYKLNSKHFVFSKGKSVC